MRPNPTQMKALSDSHHFHNFITVAILVTALIIGLQTYSELEERYSAEFAVADEAILSVFILVRSEQFSAVQNHLIHIKQTIGVVLSRSKQEFAIKLLACGLAPHRYFLDGWNVFDFLVRPGRLEQLRAV